MVGGDDGRLVERDLDAGMPATSEPVAMQIDLAARIVVEPSSP